MKDFQKWVKSSKKLLKKPDILLIPILLTCLLAVIVLADAFERGKTFLLSVNSSPLTFEKVSDVPIVKEGFNPNITAQAAIIMDKDSRTILFSKNKNLRFSPASTTKIMTSLVAFDYFKPESILTVKDATVEGTILGLAPSQKFTFENLLYAMLLPSANDAAFAIAENHPQGLNGFVGKMNEKARYLNLENTHFQDPAGLLDKEDYTTAEELARLTAAALDSKLFSKIVATSEKIIHDENGNLYVLQNRNKLLGIEGVNGVKTGTTEEAGNVLVTSKEFKGHTLILVVLRSQDRFVDTYNLLKLIDSGNLTYLSIHP